MRIYSDPITKKQAAELYTRVYPSSSPDVIKKTVDDIIKIDDVKFLKSFNRSLRIKLRLFAPGKFQVVYDYFR